MKKNTQFVVDTKTEDHQERQNFHPTQKRQKPTIATFTARDLYPYSTAENQGFDAMEPRYNVPYGRYFTETVLHAVSSFSGSMPANVTFQLTCFINERY